MIVNKKNPKSIGMTAVMNNPKLARTVMEAMQSPPGSTKRANALAVLRSVNKMNKSLGMPMGAMSAMDGKGGLSVMSPLQQPNLKVQQPQQQPNLSVSPRPSSQQPSIGVQPQAQQQVSPQSATQMLQGGAQPAVQGIAPAGRFIFPSAPAKNENALPLPSAALEGKNVEGVDFEPWYEELSPELQEQYKPIYEAVQAGVGPKTFAWGMMDDLNKLRQLPGMENMPADALPFGASLTRQIDDLKKTVKEEFTINQQQDNLRKLSERGLDITDNLQEYIDGRDEYLKRIDSMINTAKSSMIDMDLANPYVSSKMNQYMNYLYILKGKQNKRYANFLDSAIREHNFSLVRAQNAYDSSYQRFEEEFNSRKSIAEEDYNRLDAMLQEMYNNAEGRQKKEYDMGILEQQYLKAVKENSRLGFDLLSPGDMDEINTFERMAGVTLPDEVWAHIFMFARTPDKRSRLMRALQSELKSNPNITSDAVIAFVNNWLDTEESDDGSVPKNLFPKPK